MKTTRNKFIVSTIVAALLLVGCTLSNKSDKNSSTQIAEKILTNQDIKPDIKKIIQDFPTPFEVTLMLEKAQAGFIFDLANPVENLDKYNTEMDKAIYLGVYSADLSYAAAYNRANEVKKILTCTSQLTYDLGIADIYNPEVLELVKNNYDYKDSLVSIFTQVFDDTKKLLSETNRDKVSVLIVTGGFIETLHIASSLNMLAAKNKDVTKIIFDQKKNIDLLLNILNAFSSDKGVNNLIEPLIDINVFLEKTELEKDGSLNSNKANELKKLVEISRNNLNN